MGRCCPNTSLISKAVAQEGQNLSTWFKKPLSINAKNWPAGLVLPF